MTSTPFVKRIFSGTFYYGFSSILSRMIGFIMLPIYTNYLTPTDYGVAGFLILYVSLSQTLLGGQLEHAIAKLHYDKKISHTLSQICLTSASITTLFSFIPVFLGIVFSEEISSLLFGSSEYSLAVSITSLNILFMTLEIYGFQYIKIKDRAKLYLLLNVFKLFLQLSINILLVVYLEKGIIGIITSSAVAAITLSIITFLIIFLNEKELKPDFTLAKPLILFSAPLWLSGLLGLYNGSSHQVFIKTFDSLASLGLYNLAATFGGLVGALFLGPFFSFWQVERFRVYEKENATEIFQNMFYSIVGLSLFLALVIALFADPIIKIMADEAFHPSTKAVLPLTIVGAVTYMGWYFSFSFLVTDNSKELAKNSTIYTIIVTLVYFSIIPFWGYVGAAYGVLTANLINIHIIAYRAKKFYDMKISLYFVDIGIILSLAIYYLCLYLNPWLDEPFKSAGFFAIFIFLLIAFVLVFARILAPKLLFKIVSQIKLLVNKK